MSDLRALIEAAKNDAPSAAARTKVWAGVSSVVGEAAAVGGAGALAGSAGAAKLLVIGGLLGGTITVGIGAAVLVLRTPERATGTRAAAALVAPATAAAASLPDLGPRAVRSTGMSGPVAMAVPARSAAASGAGAGHKGSDRAAAAGLGEGRPAAHVHGAADDAQPRQPGPGSAPDDALAREASQLAEARNALVRRDALSALQIVRGLRSLPKRQLVPEELAIEAQALRALGLGSEADAVDARLRIQYPDSVLDR